MSVELDFCEDSTDALAQAAYVSSVSVRTSWSDSLDTDAGGTAGVTYRQVLAAADISISGNQVRVTLEGGASSDGLYLDNVAIVEQDSGANGTTTPTEILFSGTSGIEIAVGESEVSDWTTFTLDETKSYLLIMDIKTDSAHDTVRVINTGGAGTYYKVATNSYNTQDLDGATLTANRTAVINKLEVEPVLQSYSEDTIKTQGTYSLKGFAAITASLNDTLTKTLTGADKLDLTYSQGIEYDIYALRTGSNIKIGIHDSGGTTSEHTANVVSSNTNQTESWDISAISDANKDDIDSIIVTVVNADAANIFYLDDIKWGIDAVAGGGSYTFVQ